MKDTSAAAVIDALGGTTAVARLLGLKPPSVHEWRGKAAIRLEWLVLLAAEIERCTPLRRWDLRPEDWHRIWPELIGTEGAPVPPEGREGGPTSQPGAFDEAEA